MAQSKFPVHLRTNTCLVLLAVLSVLALVVSVPHWVHGGALVVCALAWVRRLDPAPAEIDQAVAEPELPHPFTEPTHPPEFELVHRELLAHVTRLDHLVAACVAKMEAATDLARKSGGQVEQGANTMRELATAVQEMDQHLRQSSEAFSDLQQRAVRIGSVVEKIKLIARQTNLLAINAAIEAARAGQLGKGFSVVSGEVKLLAARADEAAVEIGRLAEGLSTACSGAQAQVAQMQQVSGRGITHSSAVHEVFANIQSGAAKRVETVAAVFADLRAQQTVLAAMRADGFESEAVEGIGLKRPQSKMIGLSR